MSACYQVTSGQLRAKQHSEHLPMFCLFVFSFTGSHVVWCVGSFSLDLSANLHHKASHQCYPARGGMY